MASSSSLLLQLNEDYLTCKICMESFKTPKVLSCLHTFCKNCLDLCEKSPHETYILCPICRQKTTLGLRGIDSLKDNFVLSNMTSMMEEWNSIHTNKIDASGQLCQTCPPENKSNAQYQCINCLDYLCRDCATFHTRTKLTKDHKVASMQDIQNGKYRQEIEQEKLSRCDIHKNSKIQQYCCDCGFVVCAECTNENHQNHKLILATDAMISFKNEMQIIQKNMETAMIMHKTSLEKLRGFEEKTYNIKQQIEKTAEEFTKIIQERKQKLLLIVEEAKTKNEKHISSTKKYMESQTQCLKDCICLADSIMESGTVKQILSLKKKMQETMDSLQTAQRNETDISKEKNMEIIRFVPENLHNLAQLRMGVIEKEERLLSTLVQPKYEDSLNEKEHSKELCGVNQHNNSGNFSSNSLTTNIDSTYSDILYVEMPGYNYKMPQPKPRKPDYTKATPNLTIETKLINKLSNESSSMQSTNKRRNSTTISSKHEKLLSVGHNTSKAFNHYPTAGPRSKINFKDYSTEVLNPSKTTLKSVKPSRVAPSPPTKITAKLNNNTPEASTYKPPKKHRAPRPPTMSSNINIFKANFVKTFDVCKNNTNKPNFRLMGISITKTNIFILDAEHAQVRIFDSDGFYARQFEVKNPLEETTKPTGITVSNSFEIYILFSTLVTLWTIDGYFLHCFGQEVLEKSNGITIDIDGRIIVADEGKQEILIFTKGGTYVTSITEYIYCPKYITTTNKNEIVVSDCHSNKVLLFDANGKFITTCKSNESQIQLPRGIAAFFENESNTSILFIVDEKCNRISAYNCEGQFLYHVLEGDKDTKLNNPNHIAVFNEKNIVLLQKNSSKARLYQLQKTSFCI